MDHVLWHCEFAQKVWNTCPFALPSLGGEGLGLLDFLATCMSEMSSPEVEIVFATAWVLWLARNEVVWEGTVVNVADICSRAVGIALESVSQREAQRALATPAEVNGRIHRWRPPKAGIYKVNVGCSGVASGTQVGVGILVRDNVGEVVAASGSTSTAYQDNLITHAYAVLAALKLANEIGFHCIYLEMDSKSIHSNLSKMFAN